LKPCRIVIAGDDTEGYATVLKDIARRTGLADRVTIVPRHVEGADKEALFTAARVFVMTSLSENFGLASLEALRRGVPVLTTPDVGMAEIVRQAAAGAVVAATPEAIACGLNSLLGDPAAARAMGAAGRIHAMTHYGWPSVAERMEKLYETILSSRRASSSVTRLIFSRPIFSRTARPIPRASIGWSSSPTGCHPISAPSASICICGRALAERGHDVTLIGLTSANGSVVRQRSIRNV
jgi:hypothetical protein